LRDERRPAIRLAHDEYTDQALRRMGSNRFAFIIDCLAIRDHVEALAVIERLMSDGTIFIQCKISSNVNIQQPLLASCLPFEV
jgi:hypothetical protein